MLGDISQCHNKLKDLMFSWQLWFKLRSSECHNPKDLNLIHNKLCNTTKSKECDSHYLLLVICSLSNIKQVRRKEIRVNEKSVQIEQKTSFLIIISNHAIVTEVHCRCKGISLWWGRKCIYSLMSKYINTDATHIMHMYIMIHVRYHALWMENT
jgi:hypothetical protein